MALSIAIFNTVCARLDRPRIQRGEEKFERHGEQTKEQGRK
jgi:hypothetical protein